MTASAMCCAAYTLERENLRQHWPDLSLQIIAQQVTGAMEPRLHRLWPQP